MTLPIIPPVEPIKTPVRQPNKRLMELLLADRPLTAEELAEIEQAEKESEE